MRSLLRFFLASPLLLALCAAGRPAAGVERAGGADTRARYRQLLAEVTELQARQEPWRLLDAGEGEGARLALLAGGVSADEWRRALRDIEGRLERLPQVDLTPIERAQLDTLQTWLDARRVLLESAAWERSDPVAVADFAELTLLAVLSNESIGPIERVALLDLLLRELPKRFGEVQKRLSTPVLLWCREAAAQLAAFERILQEDLAPMADVPGLGERSRDAFLARVAEAGKASAELRTWLERGPARSGRPTRGIGDRALRVALASISGADVEIDRLRAELLETIARLDAGRLPKLESRRFSVPTSDQLLENLERGIEASQLLTRSLRTSELVSFQLPTLRGRVIRAGTRPRELSRLLAGGPHELVLALPEPSPDWPGALTRGVAALLNPIDVSAEAVRSSSLGEGLVLYAYASRPPEERLPVLDPALQKGFGLYALDGALRFGMPAMQPSDNALEKALQRQLLLEAARLVLAIELHADGLDEVEAVDRLRRRTGLELELAREEAERTWHDPMRGAGFLCYQELLRLEAFLAESLGPVEGARRTLALALSAPGVRPRDLRSELIDR